MSVNLAKSILQLINVQNFKKINLRPGKEKMVSFTLIPDDLELWNKNMKFVVEPGEFEIMIGSSAEDLRVKKLLWYMDTKKEQ
ncbi:MAG: hypothetical protein GWP10_21980 [Nitrospiraceae bacterium]|nr:hypothetical protein [Nitrospiraceae bacterium]